MSYQVGDIGLKINRADKHIKDCRIALEEFMGTNPYEIVRQPNLKSGKLVYIVERADPVPFQISIIVGDALQNLRTTLDYLAHALVTANNRKPTIDTSFPIFKGDLSSKVNQDTFDRKVKGMRKDVVEKIKSLKPYKGGDNVLYWIHALNNRDKHRLLLAAGSGVSIFSNNPISRDCLFNPEKLEKALFNRFVGIPGTFPLNKGQQILIEPPPPELDENVTLFGEVAINEPKIVEPIPLMVLLRRSSRRVWQILVEFGPYLRKC